MNPRSVLPVSLLVALLSLACEPRQTLETTPSRGPAAPPKIHQDAQPPLRLQVRGPSRVLPGETISVDLQIEVQQPEETVEWSLDVPPGVSLEQGRQQEKIPPGMGNLIQRHLTLRVETIPSEDLVVRATQHGASWGAQAQKSYRFGRPEPALSWGERAGSQRPGIPGTPIPIPRAR